jgi:hypothetical protein
MLRSGFGPGLSGREKECNSKASSVETRRGIPSSDSDVVCCVKTYMHSSALQQRPLVVLPRHRLVALSGSPTTMLPRNRLSAERRQELRDLAQLLRGEPYNIHRGANELERYADGPGPCSFPPTPWLAQEAGNWRVPLQPGTALFPHLPETSYPLRVRYKL